MRPRERRPRWFLLYVLVGVIAGALYFESQMPVSGATRIIAQLIVLGLASYLVYRWIDSEMPFDKWS